MSQRRNDIGPPGTGGCSRGALALLLVLAAAAALGILLPTAHGFVKRLYPPPDMPWSGHVIYGLFVAADGTWTLQRRGYLDRSDRYQISPSGVLQPFREAGVSPREDVSGGGGVNWLTEGKSLVSVMPAAPYHSWRKSLRNGGNPDYLNQLPEEDNAVDQPVAAHPYSRPMQTNAPLDKRVKSFDGVPSSVVVRFNPPDRLWAADLLPGHWFYDAYDGAAFMAPYLWITTDRQRQLHRVELSEPMGQPPVVTVRRSVPLNLPGLAQHSCRMGIDPLRHELFILRDNGHRYWFDPQSLEQTGEDQLPGVWETEYAQFSTRRGLFSSYTLYRTPLSKGQYELIMQAAMVLFLASLLGLSLLWRPQWKSTSAPTTADTSSSKDSANT